MNSKQTISTLIVALSLALGGCAVGPDYHKPIIKVTPAFKEAKGWSKATPQETQSKGEWWAVYQDPILNQLLSQVQISNQNVAQYAAQYQKAQALIDQAHASLYPSISANAGLTRSGTQSSTGNTYAANVATSSWELDLWGKVRRGLEEYQASAQASEAELANITLSAQSSLAQDYFQVRVLDARIALYQQSVQEYQRYLKVIENKYAVGSESRATLAQAQTQLESATSSMLDLTWQRAQLEHAMAILMGKTPAEFSLPVASSLNLHLPTPPNLVPSQLLERRPDIAYAERTVASANAAIGVAQAAYYPDITLSASAGVSSSVLHNLMSLPSRTWSLGPSLSTTLLDFGATKAEVAQAQASYDADVASYRQTVLEAMGEVEDYLVQLATLSEEIAAQRRATDAAKESARVTYNQYQAGMIDYLDVASTQNTSLSQQQSLLSLLSTQQVASVQLIAALGGGWQGVTALPPVPGTGGEQPSVRKTPMN